MARVVVDRENVNDEFVVIRKIYKRNGEIVATDDLVLDIETSKTVTEVRAPEGGVVNMMLSEGDEIAVGALLFEVGTRAVEPSATARAGASTTTITALDVGEVGETMLAVERKLSRAAAKLAQRLGVDENRFESRGWVTAADVLAAAGKKPLAESATAAVSAATTLVADAASRGVPQVPFRSERKSLRKRTEARNLSRANSNGSNSMIGIDVPLHGSRLVAPPFLFQGSISDLVVFEAARLLRRYPELNAFHQDERTIGYFEEIHVGISFDGGGNLKVLALRHADTLSLAQVQSGFEELLQIYESGLPIADALLSSSTVSLSDLSRSPVDFMLPLRFE